MSERHDIVPPASQIGIKLESDDPSTDTIRGSIHPITYLWDGFADTSPSERPAVLLLEHEEDLDKDAPYFSAVLPFYKERTLELSGSFVGTIQRFGRLTWSSIWGAWFEYEFTSETEGTNITIEFRAPAMPRTPVQLKVTGTFTPNKRSYPQTTDQLKGVKQICGWFVPDIFHDSEFVRPANVPRRGTSAGRSGAEVERTG